VRRGTGSVAGSVLWCVLLIAAADAAGATVYVPYSAARTVLANLQELLWPVELRGRGPAEVEQAWRAWVVQHDAAIRARVSAADDDSLVHLLQFGTSFTRQPRISEQQLAGVTMRAAGSSSTTFVPSPLLRARIDDFIAAVESPGDDERLQLARRVIDRQGIGLRTAADRARLRRYLEERTAIVGSAVHSAALHDPSAPLADQLTIFRDRALASDTLLWVDYGIESTLAEMKAAGALAPGSIRRAAVVGPGLDIVDKQEGYDFYPPQTIQPFALIDSLRRLGLTPEAGVEVTAFDLSRSVLQHLATARSRARAGTPYTVVLPRNLGQPWTPGLVKYWETFGQAAGGQPGSATAPPNAGEVAVRAVTFAPAVVQSVVPADLNVVLQRAEGEQFDLIVATNILLYYDVFEQSLAIANVAAMLRPGAFLLSNDRIFELPDAPVRSAGRTPVSYMNVAGSAPRGDQFEWYERR
jgi:hypothetical protein